MLAAVATGLLMSLAVSLTLTTSMAAAAVMRLKATDSRRTVSVVFVSAGIVLPCADRFAGQDVVEVVRAVSVGPFLNCVEHVAVHFVVLVADRWVVEDICCVVEDLIDGYVCKQGYQVSKRPHKVSCAQMVPRNFSVHRVTYQDGPTRTPLVGQHIARCRLRLCPRVH
jgi:hypothetical protein